MLLTMANKKANGRGRREEREKKFDYVICCRLMSTFNSAMDTRLEQKCVRFRALIIGRPNAGKTTILRRIAQAADGRVSLLSIISVEC
jgi:stage III sporulation protein SpoIIIAA